MEVLQAKCPICKRDTRQGEDYFPFCSERCSTADLGKWAAEEYRIAGNRQRTEMDEMEDDESRDR
jgi:endogenous inhibitor of DNA gyrase (YacG/DUF329 family)